MRTILAVGQDESLLFSRAEILRHCTGDVHVISAKPSEAIDLLAQRRFDVIVLCHTLQIEQISSIIVAAHHQGADVKVLRIIDSTLSPWGDDQVVADDCVLNEPKFLIAKVENMFNTQLRTERIH